MEITNDQISEIWEMFSEHIPANRRNDLALRFMTWLNDNEISLTDLQDLRGQDDHIDNALDNLQPNQEDDFEESEDYEY